ncbi:glycosyltransferase [Mucilaginibacter arboris]|uniref:Streptomycin biosynthesis protein StrF domain-containing protein n=1 Tax=Mucilaginibacter arboris TaxID=2682090 RepID=A0A7K1SY48_9SPHI|nr:glycosyltransferase [Mucilaginibacter arboris]MVN22242.1 hypothetical protein [Mucilaginibacter arboris]
MISIVVSTYQPIFLENLKKNLEQTIKIEYEIIAIENKGEMGICKAYNIGAEKAKFPYLCFVHEDIAFKTINWPEPLMKKFETDLTTGVIGIGGSKYKSLSPSGLLSGLKELDPIHIVQHSKHKKNEYVNYLYQSFEEVVCLDGVFLFTKKEIWMKNKFDESTFNNFHCYDLDFSFNIGLSKKVLVTNKVLLEHLSMGSYNKSWIDETIKFHNKWKLLLPKGKINRKTQMKVEWNNKITFLLRMLNFKYPLIKLFGIGLNYGFIKFFSVIKGLTVIKVIVFGHTKNILWTQR